VGLIDVVDDAAVEIDLPRDVAGVLEEGEGRARGDGDVAAAGGNVGAGLEAEGAGVDVDVTVGHVAADDRELSGARLGERLAVEIEVAADGVGAADVDAGVEVDGSVVGEGDLLERILDRGRAAVLDRARPANSASGDVKTLLVPKSRPAGAPTRSIAPVPLMFTAALPAVIGPKELLPVTTTVPAVISVEPV
jgi:hypothetical protein